MLFKEEMLAAVECLLFVSGEPLELDKIAQIIEVSTSDAQELVDILLKQYSEQKRGIQLIEIAGGYQLVTRQDLSVYVERLYKPQFHSLSHAALEALAIIAYKQPITRGDIEAIRGVQSERVLSTLHEKGLIREVGRREGPGRPILFGSTDQFLQHFGLKGLDDLPPPEQFITALEEIEDGEPAKPVEDVELEEDVEPEKPGESE